MQQSRGYICYILDFKEIKKNRCCNTLHNVALKKVFCRLYLTDTGQVKECKLDTLFAYTLLCSPLNRDTQLEVLLAYTESKLARRDVIK